MRGVSLSILNQKECAESKDTQIKPSQGFHFFIYVGKVKDRAEFLGYFGKEWFKNVARQQCVQTLGCSASSPKSSSAASFAVWLLEILGAEHFSHAAAFQIISAGFFCLSPQDICPQRVSLDEQLHFPLCSALGVGLRMQCPAYARCTSAAGRSHWSCKVLQLVMAWVWLWKLKILAPVTREWAAERQEPRTWFPNLHRLVGKANGI